MIHSPRHVRTFAELTDEEVEATAAAWESRRADADGMYVHALVNEGTIAGSSLAHSHSQLVWMREQPPAVVRERSAAVAGLLERGDLVVLRGERAAAVVHPAGRLPYETLVAGADALADALLVLRELIRRLRAVEGAIPWNAWLHDGEQPHIEVVPRLATLAGVELGAGIYVNTVAPEDAAVALRGAGGYGSY